MFYSLETYVSFYDGCKILKIEIVIVVEVTHEVDKIFEICYIAKPFRRTFYEKFKTTTEPTSIEKTVYHYTYSV